MSRDAHESRPCPSSAGPASPFLASSLSRRLRRGRARRRALPASRHRAPVHAGAAVRPARTCGSTSTSTGRSGPSPARPPTRSPRSGRAPRRWSSTPRGSTVTRVRLGRAARSCRSRSIRRPRPCTVRLDRAARPGGRAGGGHRLLGAAPGRALVRGPRRRLSRTSPGRSGPRASPTSTATGSRAGTTRTTAPPPRWWPPSPAPSRW